MTEHLPAAPTDRTGPIENESDLALGQWFWVKEVARFDDEKRGRKAGDEYEWLGCVTKIGSNYVRLDSVPDAGGGYSRRRVHFNEFWDRLRPELNAEAVIRGEVEKAQAHINMLMGKVQEVTARLGFVPQQQIDQKGDGAHNAVAIVSSQADTKAYKTSLVKAKDEDLPALFQAIEEGHKHMAAWMGAGALPLKAQAEDMKGTLGAIDDRLFTISLYAGLTEEAVQCSDGEPASMGEPLRIMQRRLYMDEEMLLSYEPGGIDISNIGEFDRWIGLPENRDRLLPFPRTLVAFRVRREEKERHSEGDIVRAYVNMQLAEADKKTFLFVRNGEQVWRLDCDFQFGELIFPSEVGLGAEPMMIKPTAWAHRTEMMPVREFEDRVKERDEKKRLHDEWKAANPEKNSWMHNPHRYDDHDFRPSEWEPFDANSVYYDEGVEKIQGEMKQHNRLAVIVQGLFDRSLVLHPHPPVRVWDAHSFERSIALIRDGDTLAGGEPPDFEAYRKELNASIGPGSIVTGQERVWMRREAEKENERQRNDYRVRNPSHYDLYRPYGNPGPGKVAEVQEWKPRTRAVVFRWERETQRWRRGGYATAPCSMSIGVDQLFNVSAYKPGDFKRFLADHRTRQAYLKWAPLMLAAEDYHAGKIKLGKPGSR